MQCLFLIYGVKLPGRNSDWAGGCNVSLTAWGVGNQRPSQMQSVCHVPQPPLVHHAAQQCSLLASVVRGAPGASYLPWAMSLPAAAVHGLPAAIRRGVQTH